MDMMGMVGTRAPFDPLAILGSALVAWWTVQQPSTIHRDGGGVVTSWDSYVGSYTLTAEGAPVYSQNQLVDWNPGIFTDGVDDAFAMASIAGFPLGNNPGSILTVSNRNNQANGDALVLYGTTSGSRGMRAQYVGQTSQKFESSDGVISAVYAITPSKINNQISIVQSSYEASNTIREYQDGNIDPTQGTQTGAYNTVATDGMTSCRWLTGTPFFGSFRLQDILIINGAITSGQRIAVEGYFAVLYRSTEWLPATHPSYMVQKIAFEGDSISDTNSTPGSHVIRAHKAMAQKRTGMANFAVATSTIADMNARAAVVDAYKTSGVVNILRIFEGTNNWVPGDTNTATFIAAMADYIDARIAAGWDRIVLCTLLPRFSPALYIGFEAWRTTVNSAFRSWLGGRVNRICDFAADAIMGPETAAHDSSLYVDGQHPTALGQQYLANAMTATLDTL